MCKCWYCVHGKIITPLGCKTFEEFVDCTTVECTLDYEIGFGFCKDFKEVENPDEKKKL